MSMIDEDGARRFDTGSQKNMIVALAASVMLNKKREMEFIVQMREEKGKDCSDLRKDIEETVVAIRVMDRLAGCWS